MYFKFGVLLVAAHVCSTLALPPCVCTRNLQPVCGSDGKTYSNDCLLNCQRSKGHDVTIVKHGSCDEPLPSTCVCPYNYAPVCGSDGNTYPNECSMRCARSSFPTLEVRHTGECRNEVKTPTCTCARDMTPVCGSDGNTYNNPCLLNCATATNKALTMKHEGPCADKVKVVNPADISCACTRNFQPICGSDSVTYHNPCMFNCATASNPHLTIKHEGACDEVKVVDIPNIPSSCACARNLVEVCGSDGNTYSNMCQLNCAATQNPSLKLDHDGRCDYSVRVVDQPLPHGVVPY